MTPARRRLAVAVGIVAAYAFVVIVGPVLAPYDPRAVSGLSLASPSWAHLLGTNDAGQDIMSQLLVGGRPSLVTSVVAAVAATMTGVAVGTTAAVVGGWVEVVVLRAVDIFLAVPGLPFMMLVAALAGPSRWTIVAVIALAGWPPIARLMHSAAQSLARRGFLDAARGFGSGRLYLVHRHLVPGLTPLVSAALLNWAATAIVLEAGLAFLGLGDPTAVTWGSMLQRALGQGSIYATSAWTWWVLPAGTAVTVAALGLAWLGAGLEPRANPRWTRA